MVTNLKLLFKLSLFPLVLIVLEVIGFLVVCFSFPLAFFFLDGLYNSYIYDSNFTSFSLILAGLVVIYSIKKYSSPEDDLYKIVLISLASGFIYALFNYIIFHNTYLFLRYQLDAIPLSFNDLSANFDLIAGRIQLIFTTKSSSFIIVYLSLISIFSAAFGLILGKRIIKKAKVRLVLEKGRLQSVVNPKNKNTRPSFIKTNITKDQLIEGIGTPLGFAVITAALLLLTQNQFFSFITPLFELIPPNIVLFSYNIFVYLLTPVFLAYTAINSHLPNQNRIKDGIILGVLSNLTYILATFYFKMLMPYVIHGILGVNIAYVVLAIIYSFYWAFNTVLHDIEALDLIATYIITASIVSVLISYIRLKDSSVGNKPISVS